MSFSPVFQQVFQKTFDRGLVAAGPSTLIHDEFTDTDGTDLVAHIISPTNTPGSSWVQGLDSNFLEIKSNRAYPYSGEQGSQVVQSGVSDCTITLNAYIALASGYYFHFLLFRFSDASNYMYLFFGYYGSAKTLQIRKVEGGATSTLAQNVAPTIGAGTHALSVTLSGSTITAVCGSNPPLVTSSAFNQTATKHGLYMYSALNYADDFKIVG